jgi:hypothetical protein
MKQEMVHGKIITRRKQCCIRRASPKTRWRICEERERRGPYPPVHIYAVFQENLRRRGRWCVHRRDGACIGDRRHMLKRDRRKNAQNLPGGVVSRDKATGG